MTRVRTLKKWLTRLNPCPKKKTILVKGWTTSRMPPITEDRYDIYTGCGKFKTGIDIVELPVQVLSVWDILLSAYFVASGAVAIVEFDREVGSSEGMVCCLGCFCTFLIEIPWYREMSLGKYQLSALFFGKSPRVPNVYY